MPKNVNSIKEEKRLEMKLKNSIVEAIFLFVYTCAILLFMWVREDALKHQWYKKYGLDRDIKPLYLFLQLDAKKEAFNKFEERLRTETNIKFSLVNIYKMNHKFTLACFATKDVVPQKRYMILAFFDKEMKLEKSIILVLNNEDKVISLPFFSQGPLTPKMLMETIMKYTDSQNNPSILNQAEEK